MKAKRKSRSKRVYPLHLGGKLHTGTIRDLTILLTMDRLFLTSFDEDRTIPLVLLDSSECQRVHFISRADFRRVEPGFAYATRGIA